MEKIGEEESLVGYYALHGDYCAVGACGFFIVINCVLLRCRWFSEERQHRFALVQLLLFGVVNVVCLGYIVVQVADDSTRTTHADIGWPYMIYRATAALNYELLFEFLPALMRDEREYLQGWCGTICVRLVLQFGILTGIDYLVDADYPLWVPVVIQGFLHFFFVVGAWLLHRRIRHEHEVSTLRFCKKWPALGTRVSAPY
ncbi:hypothetical protein AAVH_11112 [Aphelenchoides avenae]|nr:hypothetical protein AAVH_11112 [Aphelenchus avenae]